MALKERQNKVINREKAIQQQYQTQLKNRQESLHKKLECKNKLNLNREKEMGKNKGQIRKIKENKQKEKSHNQQSFNERKESTQQQKDMHTLISLMKSKLAQNVEDEIGQKKEYLKELSKQKNISFDIIYIYIQSPIYRGLYIHI